MESGRSEKRESGVENRGVVPVAVHCSKCGEELLGAVNRCWKCGSRFAVPPEMDGRPPVRAAVAAGSAQPLEAIVADSAGSVVAQAPIALPRTAPSRKKSTSDLVEARL